MFEREELGERRDWILRTGSRGQPCLLGAVTTSMFVVDIVWVMIVVVMGVVC